MNRKQFIAATLGALAAPFVIKEQAVERTPEVKNKFFGLTEDRYGRRVCQGECSPTLFLR